MSPKEKSRELIVKYKNMLPRMDYHLLDKTSVECSLIAVEEIKIVAKATDQYMPGWLKQEHPDQLGWEEYWEQVKIELLAIIPETNGPF